MDETSEAKPLKYSFGTLSFAIGARVIGTWDCFAYNGQIAQVALWNRALTAAEVGLLRFKPVTGTETGLLDAWPLDAGEEGLTGLVSKTPLTRSSASIPLGSVGFVPDGVKWPTAGLLVVVR